MRISPFMLPFGVMLMLAMPGSALAQDHRTQQPSAREELQHIHTSQSIDQELDHLTRDLQLTREQQQQVSRQGQELGRVRAGAWEWGWTGVARQER